MMIADTVLRIDLNALIENWRFIQEQVGPAKVAGVVKANGYGLGAKLVRDALASAGCRDFFVALLSEALEIVDCDHTANLYVLNGLQPGAERDCAEAGVIPVLNSLDQVKRWSDMAQVLGRRLPGVLQVDSGMSRLGLPPEEVLLLRAERDHLSGVDLKLVMSHLACADVPDAAFNAVQLSNFMALAQHFPGIPRSLDNSGGSFFARAHFDLVRAGIALYGGAPQATPSPMRAVVSLEARINQVRNVSAGTGVGYGLSHVCGSPAKIATISVGYADGWPRQLSNKGAAFIGGHRAPIAGRVSMDSITLDVTAVPDGLLYPGAPVELLGPNQTVDDVAAQAGTISYEILTQLGRRYRREYSGAPIEAYRSVQA